MLDLCLFREVSSVLSVLREFTAEDAVVTVRAKNFPQRRGVELFGRLDQRIGSLLRSAEELGTRR